MTLRPWHLLLAVAALVVPLQAGALSGGGGGLAVSAWLDYCGVGAGGISCKIDASWSGVDGADRYTATVTLADGSVRDLGSVGPGPGGGSTSVWVPYTGPGTYTVTVSAWGADPDGREKKLDEQTSPAGEDRERRPGERDGEKDDAATEPGGAPGGDGADPGQTGGGEATGPAPGGADPEPPEGAEPEAPPEPTPTPEPEPEPSAPDGTTVPAPSGESAPAPGETAPAAPGAAG